MLRGPFVCGHRDRQVPGDFGLLEPERFAKTADGVEHVDAGSIGNAFIDEQAVQVFRTRTVVADATRGGDECGEQIRARGDLHLQQRVEALACEFAAQGTHPPDAGFLVVFEETHAGQAIEQAAFALADDPGQFDGRPGLAQGMQQRQHMGDIAKRGQAQQADRCRRAC